MKTRINVSGETKTPLHGCKYRRLFAVLLVGAVCVVTLVGCSGGGDDGEVKKLPSTPAETIQSIEDNSKLTPEQKESLKKEVAMREQMAQQMAAQQPKK